jgi:predicted methyltransferase
MNHAGAVSTVTLRQGASRSPAVPFPGTVKYALLSAKQVFATCQDGSANHAAADWETNWKDLHMRKLGLSLTLAISIGAATSAFSQSTAPTLDPSWKAPEVVEFIGLKKGDKVADIVAGRLTASLAQAVGPSGKVYAVETAEVVKGHPEALTRMKALASQSPNVIVSEDPLASALPSGLDAVFIRQNYHDLYNKFMGPANFPAFNKAVFTALKPGGVYVVLDHAATAGSGVSATDTLHRIDPARVKADVLAAGFKLDAESSILANKADDHTKIVFDPSVRGHTDQFLFRFKKPN